jgi:hypothetical protein
MIDEFYIGAYWYERQLSLRQYADATHAFIALLRRIHPVFQTLQWVGGRPNLFVKLSPDLSNLDELIYCHASDKGIYEDGNPDGSPSWQSLSRSSFMMNYSTGKSKKEGRILISITAGNPGTRMPNSVLITFPTPEQPLFPHREFFNYDFLKKLFLKCMDFWKPETGRLINRTFGNAVVQSGPPRVGWLTYVRDPRAAALRNSASLKGLIFEEASDGGTLISLGPTMISPDNDEQVDNARRLRSILTDEKIIRDI